jgi:hypothetical protein
MSYVAVTLDLYSHVTPTLQQEAADALDDLLGDTLAVNLAVNDPTEVIYQVDGGDEITA